MDAKASEKANFKLVTMGFRLFLKNMVGVIILRQNTKFVWMYGAILFSFALILILFAGLSKKPEEQQNVKLSDSVSSLTTERNELYKQIKDLEQQIADKEKAKQSFYENIEKYLSEGEGVEEIKSILLSAVKEKKVGNDQLAKDAVANLDVNELTEFQKYVYDIIINQ